MLEQISETLYWLVHQACFEFPPHSEKVTLSGFSLGAANSLVEKSKTHVMVFGIGTKQV